MADLQPVVITVEDAKNPTLLVRALRVIADNISAINTRVSAAVDQIKQLIVKISPVALRDSMQSTGANPLNVTALHGVLADPQPAGLTRYSSVPAGLLLQSIADTQAIIVKNGTTYDLYTVMGGSPNTLLKLITGLGGGGSGTFVNLQGATPGTQQTGNLNISGVGIFATGITLSALTLGSVVFSGASGVLSQDNANLFWDATNHRLGIGTTAPGAKLVVNGGVHIGGNTDPGANNLAIDGLVTTYNNIATAGQGVAPIYAKVALAGQTAAIGTTTLYAVPASGAGLYRVSYYGSTTATGNAVNLQATIRWTDSTTAQSAVSASILCSVPGYFQGTVFIQSAASQNITYETSLSGGIGAGTYALNLTVERVA